MQSHMLQTACSKHEKIPEKSKLTIEFPIGLHYKNLNRKIMLKVDMGSNINCISLGTFQRLFPHQQLAKSMLLLEKHSSNGKEKYSAKNSMLCMQILHPIFYQEMLLSKWKC